MSTPYVYQTDRLLLKVLDESGAKAVLDYYVRNRTFHQPWFAARDDSVFTMDHQKRIMASEYRDFLEGRSIPFYIFLKEDRQRVIGRLSFSGIVRGCFHSCFLGYHLDEQAQGHGYAHEALSAALKIVFEDFRLHRIEANIMPHNARSISLVQRLGFQLEGLSHRYLQINGRWEDHLHYVLLNEKPQQETTDYPVLTTDRLIVRLIDDQDLPSIIQYYDRNRQFHGKFNPMPHERYSSPAYWQVQAAVSRINFQNGLQYSCGLFLKDKPRHLVGMVAISEVEPLPFSACEISYSVDQLMAGQGIMFEALQAILHYGFDVFGINRVYARLRPDNEQSIRILKILGFREEGRIREGVYMDDTWHDLLLMAFTRSEFSQR